MAMVLMFVRWDCSDKRLDLVPLVLNETWQFDRDNIWRLPGAHGDEIVRSVYLDEQVRTGLPVTF